MPRPGRLRRAAGSTVAGDVLPSAAVGRRSSDGSESRRRSQTSSGQARAESEPRTGGTPGRSCDRRARRPASWAPAPSRERRRRAGPRRRPAARAPPRRGCPAAVVARVPWLPSGGRRRSSDLTRARGCSPSMATWIRAGESHPQMRLAVLKPQSREAAPCWECAGSESGPVGPDTTP